MDFSEQCSKNNIIYRHIGIQSRCRNRNILTTMVEPTLDSMTNDSSRPYSQSVGVCKQEDVKLISGGIQ